MLLVIKGVVLLLLPIFSQWHQQVATYDLVCLITHIDETDMSVEIKSYCLLQVFSPTLC